jgi:hypothetical protein
MLGLNRRWSVRVCALSVLWISCVGSTAWAGAVGGVTVTCQDDAQGCSMAVSAGGEAMTSAPPGSGSILTAAEVLATQQFSRHLAACRVPYESTTPELQHPTGQGSWFLAPCVGLLGIPDPGNNPLVWLPAGAPAVDVLTLARSAEQRLRLPSPAMASSPGPEPSTPKIVNLPTWAWLVGWGPVSASASVPGVTVVATATPYAADWSWGDGDTTSCGGPGTPYVDGASDPAGASPDCGHTYAVDSGREPDLRFPVRASVHWRVAWSSNTGRSGQFSDLTSNAEQEWPVEQVESVDVR